MDYSIIIPAFDEEAYIVPTIKAIQSAMQGIPLAGEIIVCNNNSSDSTAILAEENGANVVFEAVNQISRARNTGARHAKGNCLIFVDADTSISVGLLQEALLLLQSKKCVGGGSVVRMDGAATRMQGLALHAWNTLSFRLKIAAGCFIFCRRDAFEDVGGFSEAVYASEEIWLSRQLRRWGKRHGLRYCILRDHPVTSSGRKLDWYGPLQQIILVVSVLLFPFLVRYKRLCGFWYNRPQGEKKNR